MADRVRRYPKVRMRPLTPAMGAIVQRMREGWVLEVGRYGAGLIVLTPAAGDTSQVRYPSAPQLHGLTDRKVIEVVARTTVNGRPVQTYGLTALGRTCPLPEQAGAA